MVLIPPLQGTSEEVSIGRTHLVAVLRRTPRQDQ